MIKKISTFLVFLFFTSANLFAQRGVHGPRVVTAANTVVNEYTAITTNSPATATSITVANSALNANGRFTGGLQPGDLIMIYQEQGAWIRNQGDVGPTDTTFGKITILSDYYSAGNWEYAQVLSVPNATTINLTCGLINGYFAGFNAFRSQVIRVPRYTTLTINVGGVLTCDDWNGTVGGVLAVEVDGNVIVNGTIDATGKGFRGGSLVGDNVTQFGTNTTYSASPNVGAERGEGIAGYQGDYTFFGGMYGRASAANGGAGGDAHNAGGGGGANGQNSTNPAAVWSGNGIPDPNGAYTAAWNLEPPVNTMTLRTAANSEGGGRGGYTFSGSNQNAGLLGPGQAGWGGDARNHQATGLGGRALAYDQLPGRFFLGGGGGAGDQNENYGGNGGDGGGLIYVMVFGSISGSGAVVSSGNAGSNAQGVPPNAGYSGADGAGGGGGGGAIVLNSVGTITGVTANANGGAGGNQVMVAGPLFFGTINEAEGPGGGGGGGHIAVSTGAITRITNGGNNGTTNSPALTEFPPNGATRGAPGTNNATVTNYNITVTNQSICATQSATITPTITGTPPVGYSFIYYSTATTGTTLGTGPSYNTGPLSAGTYTYWVGTCPGFFRVPVTITVNTTPTAPVLSSNSPICSGNLLTLFSNTVVGATYSWTGPNTFSSALEDPTIAGATVAATGTYSLTITAGVCASPQSTIAVVVNPTPAAPTVGSNSPRCVGQTLNLTANTVVGATYTWTGPNSFSSALEDPTIVGATAAATGTYTLTITVGGCISAQSTVPVIVAPTPAAPTLSSNTPVCSGNVLNLFSNTVAGGTYVWTGPNSFSSALEDPTIAAATVAATGTYSLTISVGGCTSPMSTTSVVVNPTPAAPTVGSNSPVCSGQTLNLTANTVVGATYTWTGPNSFSSALEDPSIVGATIAATGTYSLTIAVGGCTSALSSVSVIVANTPSAPTLSSNTPVCSGNTLNLFSNTVAGGTYSWTGPNSFSSALEDPTIAGVTIAATGTYSLTISIGGCTSPQSTVAVVVNPTPAAPTVGSNSPVCSGNALNLTSNTVVGATYSWTGPNSFSSSLEDPTIAAATIAATGTYSLTISVGGCPSALSTVSVVVNPTPSAPTLSSNTPVCSANALNLFSNTVVGGTYVWTGPNSFSSASEDPTIAGATIAATGTYSLTISVGGCTSALSTVAVVVNPTPAAPTVGSNTPLCEGQTLNLTANTVVGATYNWTGPNSFSSALEDPSIVGATAAATGTYSLTITLTGCSSAQSTVSVIVNALPSVLAGLDVAICAGDSTPLTGSGTGTPVWSNSIGLSCTACLIPNASPSATTTYTLTITDVNGCVNTDDVLVTVNALPVATAGSDVTFCNGDSATLNGAGGGTYSWLPITDLSSDIIANPVASPTTTTTYTLLVTDGNGCNDTDAVAVTVNALPTVSAGLDQSMCPAGNVPLNGTGAVSYVWSGGPGLSCTNCQSPIATPAVTTTYFLVGTDANGCFNFDTVVVTVAPNLTITASADQTICLGDSALITTTGTGNYVWSPSGTLSNSSLQSPMATPLATTTYTIVVTDLAGCTGTDSVTIFVNQPVVATTSGATTICIGQSTSLTASAVGGNGTYTYTWNPGPLTGSPVLVSPITTTTYTLDVVDGVGCTNQQTVTVQVNLPITASVSPNNVGFCSGGSGSLLASGSGGDGNYSYNWLPTSGLSSSTVANPTANPTATTTYTVVVSDLCGSPIDSATVTVTVFLPRVALASASDTVGCAAFCPTLAGTSSGSCLSTIWDFGDGDSDTVSSAPTHCYGIAGIYTAIFICTDSNGCVASDTITLTAVANPIATATAIGGNTYSLQAGGTTDICFVDVTSGATSWTWSFNSNTSNLQSPCFTVSDTGTYTAILLVTNAAGCTDTVYITVIVENECTGLFIPSAFSPNGDTQNDMLFVYGSCINFMQFEIYSRWGEKVFSSTNPDNGWDGTWRGQNCESGVFTYVMTGQMNDGTAIKMQGNISLIR